MNKYPVVYFDNNDGFTEVRGVKYQIFPKGHSPILVRTNALWYDLNKWVISHFGTCHGVQFLGHKVLESTEGKCKIGVRYSVFPVVFADEKHGLKFIPAFRIKDKNGVPVVITNNLSGARRVWAIVRDHKRGNALSVLQSYRRVPKCYLDDLDMIYTKPVTPHSILLHC